MNNPLKRIGEIDRAMAELQYEPMLSDTVTGKRTFEELKKILDNAERMARCVSPNNFNDKREALKIVSYYKLLIEREQLCELLGKSATKDGDIEDGITLV